jgi:FkbM family methyltransferase
MRPFTTSSDNEQLDKMRNDHVLPISRRTRRGQPRKIFLDLGANCGNTYYRMIHNVTEYGEETLSSNDWEAYLFECNPQMIQYFLNNLVANETKINHRMVQLIPRAASTTNGEIQFYLTAGQDSMDKMPNRECDPHSAYNPSGASTMFGGAHRAGTKISVESINFLEWHKAMNLQPDDRVHIKMDIEGAEVDILEQFLNDTTNQICYWELFWNEYHKEIFKPDTEEYKKHEAFENTFPERFQEKCGRPLLPNVVG